MSLITTLAILALQTPAEARMAESPAAHIAFKQAGFAGHIDEAYSEIRVMCATYQPCIDRNLDGFNRMSGKYPDAGKIEQKRLLEILRQYTKDGRTDWYWASVEYFAAADMKRAKPPAPITVTTECAARVSKDGREVRATCVTE